MQPTRWRTLFPGLLTAAAAVGLAACGHAEEPAPAPGAGPREPVAVTLAAIDHRPVAQTISVTGTLYGDEEAEISAQVPGRITEVLADVGDRLGPGTRLAQIDPTDYRLAVEEREAALLEAVAALGLTAPPDERFDLTAVPTVQRARAEAANAAAKRERGRQLFEQDPPLMSEQEFQDLVTAYEVAQANEAVALLEAQSLLAQVRVRENELATAKQQLADAAVRAPMRAVADGAPLPPYAVVERRVSLGEYVATGAPLYRLVADDPLKYRAAVPERFLQSVAPEQEVALSLDDGTEGVVGRITRITPAVDPLTRTFLVEAVVENADRRLRPGSFARGTIRTGERAGVVHVPAAAVVSFAGLDKVYSVADGKAVEHRVTPIARGGDMVPIEEPLDVREVVVEGADKLAKGAPVTLGAAADAAAR